VQAASHEPVGEVHVTVLGERLVIPRRTYLPAPTTTLAGQAATIASCLYTRHHDGQLRHEHLRRILDRTEPWVPPFVILLLGEYVVEIAAEIAAHVDRFDRAVYTRFLRENPALLPLVTQRATSYRDCYHRHVAPADYPSLRVVATFERWLAEPAIA
jgi:hypothetical protein